VIKKP